ncbi:MAG: helix-turn-helix domain-containing protein [Ruminococcus sp.]|nr:helix-turn-helix domain-containing protein [Ruminococcus sp.]
MEHSSEKIGKIIKTERNRLKWSQEKLGKYLGISGKQISIYESGKTAKGALPTVKMLIQMCDLFKCDLGYLIGEQEYPLKTYDLSIAAKETGFTEESLQQIRTVMGFPNTSKSFVFEEEADAFKRINNSFVSSPQFITLIEELKNLDDIYRERHSFIGKYNKKKSALISQLDKMDPIKAEFIKMQTPPIMVESFSPEEEKIWESLTDEEVSIIHKLDALDTDEYKNRSIFEHNMKYQRYIIQETMAFLLNYLYPINDSFPQKIASSKEKV